MVAIDVALVSLPAMLWSEIVLAVIQLSSDRALSGITNAMIEQ